MPCKDESTPKGHYFSLAAMSGEYDVTAIFAQSQVIYEASYQKGKFKTCGSSFIGLSKDFDRVDYLSL